MKSFHFSCGNSSTGPIGFCARVRAETKEEALGILMRVLPTEIEAKQQGDLVGDEDAIEYVNIYFGGEHIKVEDIDEEDEVNLDQERFPECDWKDEVANGDTKLGYAEWVAHKVEDWNADQKADAATQGVREIREEFTDMLENYGCPECKSRDVVEDEVLVMVECRGCGHEETKYATE